MRFPFLLHLHLVWEICSLLSLDIIISILTYLWARNTPPTQMFSTAPRNFGHEKNSQERQRTLWLEWASSLPFDQASSDAAIIVAATNIPTFHKNSPHPKVNTLGHTPSLLPNLFVAYGFCLFRFKLSFWAGMLCHVIIWVFPMPMYYQCSTELDGPKVWLT